MERNIKQKNKQVQFLFGIFLILSLFAISSVSAQVPTYKQLLYDLYVTPYTEEVFVLNDYFSDWNRVIISSNNPNCITSPSCIVNVTSADLGEGAGISFKFFGLTNYTIGIRKTSGNLVLFANSQSSTTFLIDDLNITICDNGNCTTITNNVYFGGFYKVETISDFNTYVTGSNIAVLQNNINASGMAIPYKNFYGTLDGKGYSINNPNNFTAGILFWGTDGGTTIKNLMIKNSVNLSSIFINVFMGTLENCYFSGEINYSFVLGSPWIRNISFIAPTNQGIIKNVGWNYTLNSYADSSSYTLYFSPIGLNAGTIKNVYSDYNLIKLSHPTSQNAIGMVNRNLGIIENSYSKVSNCYRGFALFNSGTDLGNFFDYEIAGTQLSAMGIPKTTTEMLNIETYRNANWNINHSIYYNANNDWWIVNQVDYPKLYYDYIGEIFTPTNNPTRTTLFNPTYTIGYSGSASFNLNAFWDNFDRIRVTYYDSFLGQNISLYKILTPYPPYVSTDGIFKTNLSFYDEPSPIPDSLQLRFVSNGINGTTQVFVRAINGEEQYYDEQSFYIITSSADIVIVDDDNIFGSIMGGFVNLMSEMYPDYTLLSLKQRAGYVVMSLFIATLIIIGAGYVTSKSITPALLVIALIVDFLLFAYFISIHYIGIGLLIIIALLLIAIGWLKATGK